MELFSAAFVQHNSTLIFDDFFTNLHHASIIDNFQSKGGLERTSNGTIIINPLVENLNTTESKLIPPEKRADTAAPGCLESYESCEETGQMEVYEDATFHNRSLGTLCTFFAIIPIFMFWVVVWPYDSRLNTMLINDHLSYFIVWHVFYVGSLGFFGPLVYIWTYLAWQDPENWTADGIGFYKTWMLDVILVYAPPVEGLLVIAFVGIFFVDTKDDYSYQRVHPLAVSIILALYTGATSYLLYEYNFIAREYYNRDLRQVWLD